MTHRSKSIGDYRYSPHFPNTRIMKSFYHSFYNYSTCSYSFLNFWSSKTNERGELLRRKLASLITINRKRFKVFPLRVCVFFKCLVPVVYS